MFEQYRITLASQSPRRRELLAGLDVRFEVEPSKDEGEFYNEDIPHSQVPEYLARHKSETFHRELYEDEILITADTLVFCPEGASASVDECTILGKPADREEAYRMLRSLSGKSHYVLTGVVLRSLNCLRSFTSTTEVTFREMSDEEIYYYIDNYAPYDKAGAYGVQEWIGYAAISSIKGSYYNVMGLPVEQLFVELTQLAGYDCQSIG